MFVPLLLLYHNTLQFQLSLFVCFGTGESGETITRWILMPNWHLEYQDHRVAERQARREIAEQLIRFRIHSHDKNYLIRNKIATQLHRKYSLRIVNPTA